MTATIPEPITLSPPGEREVVDEAKAKDMIALWKEQLLAHKGKVEAAGASLDDVTLCNKIILSDKSYTSGAASIISNFLTSTELFGSYSIASKITIADLSDIIASRMEEEGLEVLKTISDAFQSSNLIDLDLSDNAMGSKGITACSTVLGGSASIQSLQKLSLCNNGLSEYSMDEVATFLTAQNGEHGCIAGKLSKIHFYNNMSGDNGCIAFGKIMKGCTSKLEDIRFSGTRAKTKGSLVIAQSFEELAKEGILANLKYLDLADNSFSESWKHLAPALKQCKQLVQVNLKDCNLGDEGVTEVCNALKDAGCLLTHLYLSGNEITADGAKSVAKLLKKLKKTIVHFEAEDNEMTSIGIKAIAKALSSDTLQSINLECNECGKIGAMALAESAKKVPNLKSIQLDRNMFPEDAVEALTSAFGDLLKEMEENDDEENVDEDLDDEEDEEEDSDADVDELASGLAKVSV